MNSRARYYIPLPQDSNGNTGFPRKVIKAIALGPKGQIYLHIVNEKVEPTGEKFPLSIEHELPFAINPLSKKTTIEYFIECSGPVRDLSPKEYIELFHQILQIQQHQQLKTKQTNK